jgi:hypothetical protein
MVDSLELHMILKSQSGRIVNMASIAGSLTLHADPNSPIYHAKSFAYTASKAAVNSFMVAFFILVSLYLGNNRLAPLNGELQPTKLIQLVVL